MDASNERPGCLSTHLHRDILAACQCADSFADTLGQIASSSRVATCGFDNDAERVFMVGSQANAALPKSGGSEMQLRQTAPSVYLRPRSNRRLFTCSPTVFGMAGHLRHRRAMIFIDGRFDCQPSGFPPN